MISATDKQIITRGFERLGPARVERGLQGTPARWTTCFLASAYGDCGDLLHDAERIGRVGFFPIHTLQFACAVAFGMDDEETGAIVRAFDEENAAFRALAEEWLEQAPAWNVEPPLMDKRILTRAQVAA